MEILHFVYFNTGLVQNLGHLNVFLEFWEQLFQENLGTRRLALKLEGTVGFNSISCHIVIKSLFILSNNVPSTLVLNPLD